MIDTHAHLFLNQTPIEEVVTHAQTQGVTHIIHVGINIETSKQALALHQTYPFIYPTIGAHPSEFFELAHLDELKILAKENPFVAIGEIGLDYFKNYTDKKTQISLFEKQLEIASELNMPVIIHNRRAEEDMLAITKNYPQLKKVFHCFGSGPAFVDDTISDNTFYSFTGNITYAKKGKTVQSVKAIPLEHIMLETDCPYLTPQQYKGAENRPGYLPDIAKRVAEIKEVDIGLVKSQTTETALSFFNITLD